MKSYPPFKQKPYVDHDGQLVTDPVPVYGGRATPRRQTQRTETMTAEITFIDPATGQRTHPRPLTRTSGGVTIGTPASDFTPEEIHRIADQFTCAVTGGLLILTPTTT